MSNSDDHEPHRPEDHRDARGSRDPTGPAGTADETRCCVVGAGPAGAVLALLLARAGVPVTLLERHSSFDRDFRGDTLHPSVMEILAQLGLAERLLRLPHSKIRTAAIQTPGGVVPVADFGRLKTRFPFITMIPQEHFLEFITDEAAQYSPFRLVMGARVQELVEENGEMRGVRFRTADGVHELRASLTIGADGRFSTVRKLAGFEPIATSPPVDVLWFRLPREPGDVHNPGTFFLRAGHAGVLLDRGDQWQAALIIPKDGFRALREAGMATLRRAVAETFPPLAERVEHLGSWEQVSLLSVESSRVPRWYRPGLLLLGDAAHVMSPVAGVGINYAIQDAVEAANVLAIPLRKGDLRTEHLAEVQRRREWPTRVIQALQAVVLRRVAVGALGAEGPFRLPLALRVLPRVPVLRDLPARWIAFGLRPARVQSPAAPSAP